MGSASLLTHPLPVGCFYLDLPYDRIWHELPCWTPDSSWGSVACSPLRGHCQPGPQWAHSWLVTSTAFPFPSQPARSWLPGLCRLA